MHELLEAVRKEAKAFGPGLARAAFERGLAVTQKDGSEKPIPVTATPVVLTGAEIRRRAALSASLSSATFKMARAVLSGPAAEVLLGALSPLERRLATATGRAIERLATTRVDYFVAGQPRALEINATIPAMQAYSDIAAHSFIEAVGRHAGLGDAELARLQAANGSNALALYRALLSAYAAERKGTPRRIALLCRRADAQLTEQRALAERFSDYGTEARVVFPDELSGDEHVAAGGDVFDLVYRHLFVRRLEETPSPYVVQLLSEVPGKRAVVVNPPASQIEVKTTFALLSQALGEPELARDAGLEPGELEAIREAVPWTRAFRRGPGIDPSGASVADLVEAVASEPDTFVLKRAWDYGGKAVFVGQSAKEPSFDERVRAAYGKSLAWRELCARAAEDRVGGGFVVQERVVTHPEKHLLCSERGVTEAALYVDYSSYASVGLDAQPAWGGVCRGSVSQIVNIVGGGGVLPLLTSEVADALARALAGR